MSDDEDPFEAFETPDEDDSDRSDPFADLDEAVAGPEESDAQPGRLPDDPFDRSEGDAGPDPEASGADREESGDIETSDSADPATPTPTDDPFASFGDVADGQGQDESDDPFAAFEPAGVEGADPDAVWESLASAGATGAVDTDERVFSEVSKHRFCERCEHFSGPPDVRCTYEGAAIVEFLDMETVRLVDCPVVARQRELEEGGTDLD